MPKAYERMDSDELEAVLDSDRLTDEDACRIIHILEDRESSKPNPIHTPREEEEMEEQV